jgi:hypothetical protein
MAAPRPLLKPPLGRSVLCLAGVGLKDRHCASAPGALSLVRTGVHAAGSGAGQARYDGATFSPAGLGLLSALPGHNVIYH